MPFIEKIKTEAGWLGIWELTDLPDLLLKSYQFTETEKSEFNKIKVEKRKTEYLATRILLEKHIGYKPEIKYFKSGKPQLCNHDLNISISHSSDLLAVLISEKNIGVDVEKTDRNVEKIAHRYLSKIELNHIEQAENPQIGKILYWGAKEAVFKCSELHGIQFNTQISVHPFNIEREGRFLATLRTNDHESLFQLWYFFINSNVIVYCIED